MASHVCTMSACNYGYADTPSLYHNVPEFTEMTTLVHEKIVLDGIARPPTMVSLVAPKTTLVFEQVLAVMQWPAVAMRLGPMSVPIDGGFG